MLKKQVPYIIAYILLLLVISNDTFGTYSIVAYDKETGQIGAAVQSHWFSVGNGVIWAESGVGAVATQSLGDPSYGSLGLILMRSGKTAQQTLDGLLATDSNREVRQVAIVDINGNTATHTGKLCIDAAGHATGKAFSCQANLMLKDTVWKAMSNAFETTQGELVDRLLAALDAAQKEGGDIRGQQSASILVVKATPSDSPQKDVLFNIRVEDHPDPLTELHRLVHIAKAYNHMNQGDIYLSQNNFPEALKEYRTAMSIYPDNPEIIFWPAVTMAATGKVEESLPLFKLVFSKNKQWAEVLKRLPKAQQFPNDETLINKILQQCPK